MSRTDKTLKAMKLNPKSDWHIEDLKSIAQKLNVDFRQPGGSHVTFRTKKGNKLTVPARKPIKAIYIKMFIELIEKDGEEQ